jgi:hypothetical protein
MGETRRFQTFPPLPWNGGGSPRSQAEIMCYRHAQSYRCRIAKS